MDPTDCIDIPQIRLTDNKTGMNCLIFTPMQMAGLLGNNSLNATTTNNNTIITYVATDQITGQQSEIPVFQGYHASSDTILGNNESQIGCMVKLIKKFIPELSQISYPQIDGITDSDELTSRLFDNIRMSVAICGSSARYYNRCYITGRDYSEAECELLTGRIFSGARSIYGDRHYLVILQYSKSCEHLFPVADAYFNLTNRLVPLQIAAPGLSKIAESRDYLKCQVRRTNGQLQLGFIKLGYDSMLIYKSHHGELTKGLIPYITVYFNNNGSDVLDVQQSSNTATTSDTVTPAHDSFKTVRVADLLTENPEMRDSFTNDLNFENLGLKLLYELIKNIQQ